MYWDVVLPNDDFWPQRLSEGTGVQPRVVAQYSSHGDFVSSMEVHSVASNFDLLVPRCDENKLIEMQRPEIDRQIQVMLAEIYEKYGDDPKVPIPRE